MSPGDLIERAFTEGVGVILDGDKVTLDGPKKAVEKWMPKFEQNEKSVVRHLQELDKNQTVALGLWDKTPKTSGKYEVSSHVAKTHREKSSIPELLEFRPFPVENLPKEIGDYVNQVAASVCCDTSFVALPLLAGLASAIGNSLVLQVKRGWNVPSILWCAVVAPSGSAKSVPPKKALKSLFTRQRRLVKQFEKDWQEYESALAIHEKEVAEWKKSKDSPKPYPESPEKPVCQRVVVSDATVEALGDRLSSNPRGVLALYDELAGWLGSFNRYKKASSDEASWLEFYNGNRSVIDRASNKKPLMIERASVSLFGTIQPSILRKHLTSDYKASGLAARLLFAMPPRQQKQWSDFEVDDYLEERIDSLFECLLNIEMQVTEDGEPEPALMRLDSTARELFICYYNRHNREQQALDEDLYAAYSKLEEVAARLALVIHTVRYAIGETSSLYTVDLASMSAGIELAEWFKFEAKRLYAVLGEDELAYENRQIIQWITSQGGSVSARELQRGQRTKFTCSEEAEVLLQSFAKSGLGEMVLEGSSETGGRPSYRFHLTSLGQNPKNPSVFEGSVTEPGSSQEWRP